MHLPDNMEKLHYTSKLVAGALGWLELARNDTDTHANRFELMHFNVFHN